MKKSLLMTAVLCAFAGASHAQSNVTLYGVLDQSIGWQNNAGGKSLINTSSGAMQGSRWGLRGTEDLGGGLKAIFVLENGFDLGNGESLQGGRMFGRQAFVGLSSNDFGTLTLGRQYDALVDFVAPLTIASRGAGGIGAHYIDFDNLDNSHRANNAIKYTSANYGGFSFGGTVSPGGIAGKPGKNLVWSLGANYANGPLVVAAGYLRSKDPAFSVIPRITKNVFNLTGDATLVDMPGLHSNYRVAAGGASYTFGPARIGAVYSDARQDTTLAPLEMSQRAKTAEVNFGYQLTPSLSTGLGYGYTALRVLDKTRKYHQVSAGTSYALSKRTDVYLIAALQKASGDAARAALNGLAPSSTDKQVSARVGIRHKF
ncbi:porin [Robbsia sp. Bb-Pol-6]|uniref:Porin n=1 Tax=Robbsia betulipollinis TaxID=2981849 RepID=A0ABT3ZQU3_9BURK|nr:porin [Robbsia betulipollinis]MCY0388792.1 porin [Robbsia betulipollinis]